MECWILRAWMEKLTRDAYAYMGGRPQILEARQDWDWDWEDIIADNFLVDFVLYIPSNFFLVYCYLVR